jgi:hypothetical protein
MYYNARRNARAAGGTHGIALAYPARQEQFLIGVCAGRGLSCRNKNKMAARATQPSPGALPSSSQKDTAEGKIDERLNRFT